MPKHGDRRNKKTPTCLHIYILTNTHGIMKSKVWPTASLHELRHHHLSRCTENEGGSQSPILMPPKAKRAQILGGPKYLQIMSPCPACLAIPASTKTQSLLAASAHSSALTPSNRKCHSNPAILINGFSVLHRGFSEAQIQEASPETTGRQASNPGPMLFLFSLGYKSSNGVSL